MLSATHFFIFLMALQLNQGAQAQKASAPAFPGAEKLTSLHTVSTVTGLLANPKEELTVEEWFQPSRTYALELKAPANIAGRRVLFTKNLIAIVAPQKHSSLTIKNLPTITDEAFIQKARADYNSVTGNYVMTPGGFAVIKGQSAVNVVLEAKPDAKVWVPKATLKVDMKFQQPMESDITYRGGKHAVTKIETFQPNVPIAPTVFTFEPAPQSANFEVNFSEHPLSEKEVKAKPVFLSLIPSTLPSGYKATGFVEHLGPSPAFASLYTNAANYIIVVALYKSNLADDVGLRLAVRPGRDGLLVYTSKYSYYMFRRGDYEFFVIGNAIVDRILDFAAQLN